MTIIRKWHPAAAAFPLLQGDELQQFVEDIKANGLRKPIEIYDGQRFPEYKGCGIDGRNRNAACLALEIDPPLKYLTDADLGAGQSLTAYIVSANVARRHLTSSQAAMVGVAVKKQLEAEAKQRSLANLKRGAEVPEWPGHPGSCLPGFPQIRTCPIRAYGSSSHWFAITRKPSGPPARGGAGNAPARG